MRMEKEVKTVSYKEYKYLVYVRVSTDKDSQKDSVSNQIDICRYWLERNHFEWNEDAILKDEGKSGTLFLERLAMQKILQKARAREIKMVVFKSIHRLARDLKDALEIKEVLVGHGVRVVTLEEGYDSLFEGKNDMKFEMFSMFAAQYPKTLSVSVSAALAAKVRRKEHIGPVPYGYDRVDQKLVIKEDEAKAIRQIFHWYKQGYGFKKITHMLNAGVEKGEFLPPKKRSTWQMTSVQRIIRNPVFCGNFILNQYTTVKMDGRKKQIKNPIEKWTIFENQHPGIVSVEDWEFANDKKAITKKTKITPWNEFRGGLMKCAVCGCNMVVLQSWKKKKDGTKTVWNYLKCSAYRRAGKNGCINHAPLHYKDFRDFVVEKLIEKGKAVSLDYEQVFGEDQKRQKTRLVQLIEENEKKSDGLLDLYLDQLINKDEFEAKRMEFSRQIEKYKDQLAEMDGEEVQEVKIKDIKAAFETVAAKKEDIHYALNVLIDHIAVHQDKTVDILYKFENFFI